MGPVGSVHHLLKPLVVSVTWTQFSPGALVIVTFELVLSERIWTTPKPDATEVTDGTSRASSCWTPRRVVGERRMVRVLLGLGGARGAAVARPATPRRVRGQDDPSCLGDNHQSRAKPVTRGKNVAADRGAGPPPGC